MNTTALALALVQAPTTTTERVPFEVVDVDVETRPRSSHLFAFDRDGEVSAEIIVQLDANGQPRLDVTFADGLYLTSVDGQVETDDAAEVATRLAAIDDRIALVDPQERSWTECAGSVVVAGGTCALAPPFLCVATTFLAICACLPLLSELTGDDAECG